MKLSARFGGLGLEMALSVGVGLWIGQWIEKKWHFAPIGTYVGLSVGLLAAIAAVVRVVREIRNPSKIE